MARYNSKVYVKPKPNPYENCYMDLELRIDTPCIIRECKNNYFHSVNKIANIRQNVLEIKKEFENKFHIGDVSVSIRRSDQQYDFMCVVVSINAMLCKDREEIIKMINKILFSVEYYEQCLANNIAKHKHLEPVYANPEDGITKFDHEPLDYEIKYKEFLERKKKGPEQLSFQFERYCISLSDYLKLYE